MLMKITRQNGGKTISLRPKAEQFICQTRLWYRFSMYAASGVGTLFFIDCVTACS